MSKSQPFNIVVYPPEAIRRKAIEVSRDLQGKGGLFVLDDIDYFPHVTIIMQELPLENLANVREMLRGFAAELKPFALRSVGYRQNDRGYAHVEFEGSHLRLMQKEIGERLISLRNGLLRKGDDEYMKSCSELEANNIRIYGYRFIGENYHPHITFTKFESRNDQAYSDVSEVDFSFEAAQIGLFTLGQYGTCRELVELFNLSK